MRIVLLSNMFAPEQYASAPLNTEACRFLAAAGHEVTVVTAFPHYPEWRVWPEYRGRLYARERLDGVDVRRIWSYVPRSPRTLGRILHYAVFAGVALPASVPVPRPDVVLCVTPPVELGVTAWLLKARWRAPFVLWIKDLVPEIAIQLGMLRNRAAIALARGLERFAYRRADALAVLTEGFRQHVLACGVPEARVRVVPDWIDVQAFAPEADGAEFRREWGIPSDALLVVHSGNVGVKQGLETAVEAARRLVEQRDIVFAIVGDGSAKQELVALAERLRLRNVKFIPVQPRAVFPRVLAAADVLLLHQKNAAVETVIPSKLLSYMASGRAIVACTHPASETARVVEQACCGLRTDAESPEALAEGVLALRADAGRRRAMGAGGRAYVEARHERTAVLTRLDALLRSVARREALAS